MWSSAISMWFLVGEVLEIYQKMVEASFSETSVDIDRSVSYHNPEGYNPRLQRYENLKYDTSCSFAQNNLWEMG
jgi:hypothetical protein